MAKYALLFTLLFTATTATAQTPPITSDEVPDDFANRVVIPPPDREEPADVRWFGDIELEPVGVLTYNDRVMFEAKLLANVHLRLTRYSSLVGTVGLGGGTLFSDPDQDLLDRDIDGKSRFSWLAGLGYGHRTDADRFRMFVGLVWAQAHTPGNHVVVKAPVVTLRFRFRVLDWLNAGFSVGAAPGWDQEAQLGVVVQTAAGLGVMF